MITGIHRGGNGTQPAWAHPGWCPILRASSARVLGPVSSGLGLLGLCIYSTSLGAIAGFAGALPEGSSSQLPPPCAHTKPARLKYAPFKIGRTHSTRWGVWSGYLAATASETRRETYRAQSRVAAGHTVLLRKRYCMDQANMKAQSAYLASCQRCQRQYHQRLHRQRQRCQHRRSQRQRHQRQRRQRQRRQRRVQ